MRTIFFFSKLVNLFWLTNISFSRRIELLYGLRPTQSHWISALFKIKYKFYIILLLNTGGLVEIIMKINYKKLLKEIFLNYNKYVIFKTHDSERGGDLLSKTAKYLLLKKIN